MNRPIDPCSRGRIELGIVAAMARDLQMVQLCQHARRQVRRQQPSVHEMYRTKTHLKQTAARTCLQAASVRYRPNVVTLPAHGKLSRSFHDPRQHLPGRAPLEQQDYADFERLTLLHDVFLAADGQAVEAIGPPLVNLARAVLPLELSLPGQRGLVLRHRMRHFDRVTLHRFALPRTLHGVDALDLRLAFAHGQTEQVVVHRQQLPPAALQVTTLQKNNPARWILDWLDWLALLGVERVLLYDNGSDDADALYEALCSPTAGSRPRPALVFVDWPYAYGPVRSYYNQFAQATQNNHAHRCFGAATWTGHFDVDEYPLVGSGPVVAGSLRRRIDAAGARTGMLRLDSYWMPDVRDVTPDTLPTVHDFDHRERAPHGRSHKYLVRSRALRMANTHNARLRPGWAWRTPPADDTCFLHYKPLTTHWRDYVMRGTREPFDPALHIAERRVIEALANNRGKP